MRAGQLDRRVTIERPGMVEGEYGPQPGGWVPFAARVPAQVKDALPSKSETVQEGLSVATHPARLRIRYLRGITSAMRITLHGDTDEVFQIVGGPAEIGRREWLEMTIEQYSTQGQ
ncbi:phage head-tail joining protein [Janthinobacterium sp. HH104]|uniref:head-tail adaptor protein n=1 Tax=Janthinobacterium sp. HH104 TaxID=1537276 RepID=UPI0008758A8A|nr:head-tail adaptor protein [Janthinobacterium sp. HH104]OEZ80989.1 phage head-tail joining protein [Janthinobacterium sp. HH104]